MPFSKYSRRALKSFGLISLLFACAFATGKVNLAWYEELGGSMAIRDDATAMALDSAGNVLVTGWLWHDGFQRYNFSTAKYDPDGNLLWETRYNGTGSSNDIGVDVATDSANNVYVTGFSRGPNGKYDYATVKYDSSGVEQWATRYNGPSNNADSPTSMKVDGSGNVYVTGWSEDASMTRDIVTIKYSTNGNQLWARRYAGINAGYVEARSLAIDGSGNVFVTGNSFSTGGADVTTLKYDSNGNLAWARQFNGTDNGTDIGYDVAVDNSGNVVVIGRQSVLTNNTDILLLKYDTNGTQLWDRNYDGPDSDTDEAFALAIDDNDNIIATGRSFGSGTAADAVTVKFDSSGNLQWSRHYNKAGTTSERMDAIALDSDGNAYVTGQGWGNVTERENYLTIKYDSDGNEVWLMEHNGPGNDRDWAADIVVDAAKNVYVTGSSWSATAERDYGTLKYVQATSVLPSSFSIFRGLLTGGGLSDLFDSDDDKLLVQAFITLNNSESPLQIIVTGTSDVEAPSELRFKLEASVSTPGLMQTLYMLNYDTGLYEEVDFWVGTPTDSIVEVVITTNPKRFVQAGTRQMRAKVTYDQIGIVLHWPWRARIDQTIWTIFS